MATLNLILRVMGRWGFGGTAGLATSSSTPPFPPGAAHPPAQPPRKLFSRIGRRSRVLQPATEQCDSEPRRPSFI